MSNFKIATLNCWYGPYPWYFPYFIYSCSYNPTIDFFIITDNLQTIPNLPNNVKIIYKTLNEIKITANGKLGFEVRIDYPYKLCDFKPAYGFIFSEIIYGYDFWAWSDLDIIFGNLRDFFTTELLSKNDFISTRHDYTTGCFALIKNNIIMNRFFMRSNDYKKVLSTKEYLGFDELNFKHCEIEEGKSLEDIKTEIVCFTHLIKHAANKNIIKAYFDFILLEGIPGKIKFANGKLIYDNKYEAALYHLYWLKKIYQPKFSAKIIPTKFSISKTRIY